jgi:cell division protein ZapA (FtsZ GTPase activity inhibitor)
MMNNRVIYTYVNNYLNNMKNNSNAVDKSLCTVITGMVTYTMYMKLQNYIHYFEKDAADPSTLPILPNLPTSQIS